MEAVAGELSDTGAEAVGPDSPRTAQVGDGPSLEF